AALVTYGKLIMPERDLDATIRRLEPMLNDPDLARKVDAASAKAPAPGNAAEGTVMNGAARTGANADTTRRMAGEHQNDNNPMLSQVVGIIIGSPEYQRR